jgi:hypothetical protein
MIIIKKRKCFQAKEGWNKDYLVKASKKAAMIIAETQPIVDKIDKEIKAIVVNPNWRLKNRGEPDKPIPSELIQIQKLRNLRVDHDLEVQAAEQTILINCRRLSGRSY